MSSENTTFAHQEVKNLWNVCHCNLITIIKVLLLSKVTFEVPALVRKEEGQIPFSPLQ